MGCGCAQRREKLKKVAAATRARVQEVLAGDKPISIGGKNFFVADPQKSSGKDK